MSRASRVCIVAAMLLSFPFLEGCNDVDKESAPSPSDSFGLTQAEIAELTKAAEQGDIAAMKRLSLYYAINQQDEEKGILWLERAAEAGDFDARESVLGYYSDRKSPEKREFGESLRKKWGMK